MVDNIDTLTCDEREFTTSNEKFRIYNVDTLDKMYSKVHEHGFVEIFVLLSGSVSYVFEHGSYELRDFDILIVPPHELHQLVVTKKNVKYKRMVLWISLEYLKELSSSNTDLYGSIEEYFKDDQYVIRNPEFTFKIKPYLEKVTKLQEEKPFGGDLLIENTIRELFIEMASSMKEERANVPEVSGDKTILSIYRYVEENLSTDLTLEQISSALNFNGCYISHLFSEATGTTIHKYIMKKRLSQSRKYIEKGYSNKQLIKLIGFNDESHFTQSFKKEYGYTPMKYRERVRSMNRK